MCVRPNTLPDGTQVACRKCWQCIENRVNDWVGRCIAESMTCASANTVTLTYGKGDHVRAAVLTFSDVQKYLKRLRSDGYPVRYFAVGEYGSMKARAHWHLVLFWLERAPPHQVQKAFRQEHWALGHSFWDGVEASALRYVCKYVTKDARSLERQGHLSMSKKPPLGAMFFAQRAQQFVDQALSPQDAFYSFRQVEKRPTKYMLSGRSLDLFLEAYVEAWMRRHGKPSWPHSDLVAEYLDRVAGPQDLYSGFEKRIFKRGSYPYMPPPGGGSVRFSEPHNAYFCVFEGQRLWWSFDIEGNRAWASEIRTEAGAPLVRRAALAYREQSARSNRAPPSPFR